MLGKIREWLRILVVLALLWPVLVQCTGNIRHYKFNVMMRNITRVCSTKPTVTVNGKFPGPTIYAREDDTLLIKVVNQVHYNLTVHWHGVKQIRTCWSDGPAYIAQCPIQPGKSYVYNFTVTDQRGTLFWHAHILWLRATVHGAIVILPTLDLPYPFSKPQKEVVIILGEWWKSDVEAVIDEATQSGLPPNISDAHTINGLPGPVSTCLSQERFNFLVEPGKKYLLRIINAALNEELFFKIAGHNLTVVEVDAAYVKPFETETILTAPGQTTNVILSANHKSGKYLMVTSPYMDSPLILVNNKTATATLQYISTNVSSTTFTVPPHRNATSIARKFMDSLRSLNSKKYPAKVPMKIDHSLFFIISLGLNPCASCYKGFRIVAAINNVTFVMPSVSLLNAHFNNRSGAFTDDFPGFPQYAFDYTGIPPENLRTMEGTKLYRLEYNSSVQLILQDTGLLSPENHPMHLHGFNFFVVGRGKGNFNPKVDPKNFNLVDPVERNTINAPSGGWVAIRFRANNPGVWFLHCHLEVHTTWGLKMAFVVDNGNGPNESLLPPPNDLPKC